MRLYESERMKRHEIIIILGHACVYLKLRKILYIKNGNSAEKDIYDM